MIEIDLQIRNNKKFDGKSPLTNKFSIEDINILDNIYNICQDDIILKEKMKLIYNNNKFFLFIKNINEQYKNLLIIHPNNKISLKYLTPFQENETHRVFGYFRCSKCKNKWTSSASWKNKWQKCKKCDSMIYPYNQHMLKKNNIDYTENISKLPHDQKRCGKCIEYGTLCC